MTIKCMHLVKCKGGVSHKNPSACPFPETGSWTTVAVFLDYSSKCCEGSIAYYLKTMMLFF